MIVGSFEEELRKSLLTGNRFLKSLNKENYYTYSVKNYAEDDF